MPIINSLGALTYPKITATGLGPAVGWVTLISRTGISLYTREPATSNGAGSLDEHNVVCVDHDGNLYIHASTIPTGPAYTNATRYLIQLDSNTGNIGSYLFSQGGQGFTAINPIALGNNDVYFPFDQYISGSGGTAQIQNALQKTSAGAGATGYDVGTGSSNGGTLKRFMSGKQNQNGMFLLSYTTEGILGGRTASCIGYNCIGINCTTTFFNQLSADIVGSCVNPTGEVVMKLINKLAPYYSSTIFYTYIGNVTSGWSFQSEWQIDDMVSDSSYIYAMMSRLAPTGIGAVYGILAKIDITTGNIVSAVNVDVLGNDSSIIFGDDGYLYASDDGLVVKLDTSLNLINSTAIKIKYQPISGTMSYARNINVRSGYLYGTFRSSIGNIIAYKIPNNNTLIAPNAWWLGSGAFVMEEVDVNSTSYSTSNIVFTSIDPGRNITFSSGSSFSGTYTAPTVSTSGTVDYIAI